jgi:hypothetical protein
VKDLIEAAASMGSPWVRFAPQADFERELSASADVHPALATDEGKAHMRKTYRRTALLIPAARYWWPELDSASIHRLLFHAAQYDTRVFALSEAALVAWDAETFPFFDLSMRLDGFIEALEAWTVAMKYCAEFDGKKELSWAIQHGGAFWTAQAQGAIADEERADALFVASRQARDRIRKPPKDGPRSKLKAYIQAGWIPAAFWAMTSAQIACKLEPHPTREGGGAGNEKRVTEDIRDLKFSPSHRGKYHGAFIEAAEKRFRKADE